MGGGIFVCCVAAVLLALYLTSRGGAAPAPPPPAVAAPSSPAPTPQPAAGLPTAAAPARLKSSEASEPAQAAPDMNQLLRELRRAADEIGEPAAAKAGAERFAGAVATLGRWWPRAEVGQRSAMIEAVVEAVYRSSAQETVRAAVLAALTPSATLARGTAGSVSADGLSRALLGAGVMARLSRERDLPPAVADWLSAEYARLVGPDRPGGLLAFDAGAMHALRLAPLRIVGDGTAEATEAQAALTVWFDAAAALIGSGANAARMLDAAVLDALELLMAEGPSVKASKASYNVIGALAGRLRWRAGDDSRLRLLSWFADPKVSTEALSVVTGAIVTRSSAEGVDLSMVLQAGATGEQRAALRESYALAWQLSAAGGDRGAAQAWLTAARELLGQASASGSSHEALVQAARFARLNEGAVNRKRQQTEAVARAVQQQTYGMILIPINPVTGGPQSPAGDGAWALKFLSGERASAGRRDRIRELEGFGGNIGPVDAEVLAEVAMATLAPEVRVDAQRAAARFSGSPAMVHAALKMLPRAARLQSTVQMIENLSGRPVGPATSDRWQIEARRALVEKLIELLAGQNGAYQSIDRLAAQFAETYAAMAGREPSPGGYTDDQAGQAARDMAEAYWLVLRSEAGRLAASPRAPVRLDDIDRRREARFAVAGGLLQQFAVEQVGCAELLGYIIAAESPTRATQAADVLTSMHEQRRKAGTILDQLLIVERSMTRLWMVRFGESEP
ncbi:MAG: hypothetical protein KIT68_06670 [Phycisphaeraceae bacterium]|nr:hypothetical protein [Phycisphaeraceae bacterium]